MKNVREGSRPISPPSSTIPNFLTSKPWKTLKFEKNQISIKFSLNFVKLYQENSFYANFTKIGDKFDKNWRLKQRTQYKFEVRNTIMEFSCLKLNNVPKQCLR